jgi:hypothetical protein
MENVEAAAVKHVRLAPILRESGLAKLTASAPSAKSVLGHEADRQAKFPNARNGSRPADRDFAKLTSSPA